MNTPTPTYRMQFSPSFGLQSASAVVPYLADLGISDLCGSPIFQAARGSGLGYDMVDLNHMNPELGGFSDLELFAADVSISVESAADVAKEEADLVVLEKDLGVLVQGVKAGRRTFANTPEVCIHADKCQFREHVRYARCILFSAIAAEADLL